MGWTRVADSATFPGFITNMEQGMPETDIYKNREQPRITSDNPRSRKKRRRRASSRRAFDSTGHRRRSKNSGLRRLIHLYRKGENEKHVWWGFLIALVTILALIGIWQYWYLEHVAREQARQNEATMPVFDQLQVDSAPE